MRKRTFYPTTFHTNPFAYQQHFVSYALIEHWETEGKGKRIELINKTAKELGISRMNLNVAKATVFDTGGKEHPLAEFPEYVELHPKGMDTEFFVREKTTLSLEKGSYSRIRFYLADGTNSFVYSDRSREILSGIKHIDFELKSELAIETFEDREVVMQFDLTPYSLGSIFTQFKQWFKRPRTTNAKLAASFAS